jgi:hypothetical protein
MCANSVDLGHACRLCGKPLLSCWDGAAISWHADEADARACGDTLADLRPARQPAMWASDVG